MSRYGWKGVLVVVPAGWVRRLRDAVASAERLDTMRECQIDAEMSDVHRDK
jgi:hypothetical protein